MIERRSETVLGVSAHTHSDCDAGFSCSGRNSFGA